MRYRQDMQDNKRQRAGPAQQHCDSFRFRRRRAAFYNGLKSKVGLAAATGKTAAYADQSQHRRNVVTVPGCPGSPPNCFRLYFRRLLQLLLLLRRRALLSLQTTPYSLDLKRVYVTPFLEWAGRLPLGQLEART